MPFEHHYQFLMMKFLFKKNNKTFIITTNLFQIVMTSIIFGSKVI
jgi:hypothetical protein